MSVLSWAVRECTRVCVCMRVCVCVRASFHVGISMYSSYYRTASPPDEYNTLESREIQFASQYQMPNWKLIWPKLNGFLASTILPADCCGEEHLDHYLPNAVDFKES